MSTARSAVEIDVLVVGSGPAGASAALFLATYGTRTLLVTKYSRLSDTPRAHITNQRTMETLRDMGIEDRLMREATPWEWMATPRSVRASPAKNSGAFRPGAPTPFGTPTTSCRARARCSTRCRQSPSRSW